MINVPLQLATTADIKQVLYKSADAIVLPVKERLDMFRNIVGSGKIGNVSITDETAEVCSIICLLMPLCNLTLLVYSKGLCEGETNNIPT